MVNKLSQQKGKRARSSAWSERLVYTEKVPRSNRGAPNEEILENEKISVKIKINQKSRGSSVVERVPEEHGVGCSIHPRGTKGGYSTAAVRRLAMAQTRVRIPLPAQTLWNFLIF